MIQQMCIRDSSIIVQDDAGTDWMIYHSYVKENGEVGGRLGMLDRVLWTEDGYVLHTFLLPNRLQKWTYLVTYVEEKVVHSVNIPDGLRY